jgi:hypothetical protein
VKWNAQLIEDNVDPLAEIEVDRAAHDAVELDPQSMQTRLKELARAAEREAEKASKGKSSPPRAFVWPKVWPRSI